MAELTGKTALVTGGTSGIGEATAVLLAQKGARVVIVSRTREDGDAARARIVRMSGSDAVGFVTIDLSSLGNVREGAKEFLARYPELHLLFNIAGVMPVDRETSKDGIELNHAVNYFAPVLLTRILLPHLKQSAPARIINVSSSLHREGTIDLENLKGEGPYDRYKAYADSKLMFLMYTRALAEELTGTSVTANATNPGWIRTKLAIEAMSKSFFLARWYAILFKMRPPEEAAARLVKMATEPSYATVSGAYFGASGKGPGLPSEAARDDVIAKSLKEATDAFLAPYLV